MPVTISTIKLSRFGIQPLLIMSDQDSDRMRRSIAAYIVWPEVPEDGSDVVRLFELSMPFFRGATGGGAEKLEAMKAAAHELALHRGGEVAQMDQFPPDEVTITPVDLGLLKIWRSLALFPGLQNSEVLDSTAAEFIFSGLEQPYAFTLI